MKQSITTPAQLSLVLQSARKLRGLTQAQIAKSIDLSQASLSRLEINTQNMKLTQLLAMCRHLGLELVVQNRAPVDPDALPATDRKAGW